MGMQTTEQGIDWFRLQPKDMAYVATIVDAAASTPCEAPTEGYHYYGTHNHYTTLGGEAKCITNAMEALRPANRPMSIDQALQRAVDNTNEAKFTAHVTHTNQA